MIGTGALVKGTGAVVIGTGAESIRGPRKGKRAGKRIMVGSPRIKLYYSYIPVFFVHKRSEVCKGKRPPPGCFSAFK